MSTPTILLLNGSPAGDAGNTAIALRKAAGLLAPAECELLSLEHADLQQAADRFTASDAVIVGTGTYWDSWGSPLQRFLEATTSREGAWLGKPVAVLVTAHSVGGKAVLSRLQGVLNTLGCPIPPMSGVVLTLANQLALKQGESEWSEDLWRPQDLEIVCKNLLAALRPRPEWQAWPVDRADPARVWLRID